MKVFPLESISIENAMDKQFRLVEIIMSEFSGLEFLNMGDLGINKEFNKPIYTEKVERVIAKYFNAEKAVLVTGAGTGAIRNALQAAFIPTNKILVHTSPIYPSTKVSIDGLNLEIIKTDFNDLNSLKNSLNNDLNGALIQLTRQLPSDSYSYKAVIECIKNYKDIPIITDDNYGVMKVDKIGVELNADLSTFSSFKLLGPEGVGVVVGKEKYINKINEFNYSGGSKVQGYQAMEVLRGLTYAPVMLAIQAIESEKLLNLIINSNIPEIKNAFIANSQSKVVIVEFNEDIAELVLNNAEKLGALPHPVGAESKYEIPAMFYRASGTYLKGNPSLKFRMIRINLNRSGSKHAFEILIKSIRMVKNVY